MRELPRSRARPPRRKQRKRPADGSPLPKLKPRKPYYRPPPMPPGERRPNKDGTPRKVRTDAGVARGSPKRKRRERADKGHPRAEYNLNGNVRRPWGDTDTVRRWRRTHGDER